MVNLQRTEEIEDMVELQVFADKREMRTSSRVQFLNDLDSIDQHRMEKGLKGHLHKLEWTSADLLFRFLQFYCYDYKQRKYAIHIGPTGTSKDGQVYFNQNEINALFKPNFTEQLPYNF